MYRTRARIFHVIIPITFNEPLELSKNIFQSGSGPANTVTDRPASSLRPITPQDLQTGEMRRCP